MVWGKYGLAILVLRTLNNNPNLFELTFCLERQPTFPVQLVAI